MSALERRLFLAMALIGLAAACLIVFLFNPEQYHFYGVCVFHQVTGWQCPGCGGLRATHQLLHGNFAAAWGFNPMVVLMAPVAGWFLLREVVRECTGRILPGAMSRPIWLWAAIPAVLIFGVLRNVL